MVELLGLELPENPKKVMRRPAAPPSAEEEKTCNFKSGWKIIKLFCANGRAYKKWVSPEGIRYNSEKKATKAGFKRA